MILLRFPRVSVPLRGLGNQKPARVGNSIIAYVSVPLRGLGNQKPSKLKRQCNEQDVSVPLRGLGNQKRVGVGCGRSLKILFQSPCGDQVIRNSGALCAVAKYFGNPLVSVPLRGLGNQKLPIFQRFSYQLFVSVPLRGLGNQKPQFFL